MLRALVISLLVRLGMLLVTPLAAVLVFFLRISTRSQNQLFGFLFPLVIATPVVLAAALFWWVWLAPRQAGKSYRGIPLAVAVMGLLIAALPLPFDRTPSLLTHGERVFGRVRVPVRLGAFTERVQSFFDTCSEADDCSPTRGGVPRRCAAATDGERMCVEVARGWAAAPPRRAVPRGGCVPGWRAPLATALAG
ncbi:hypothetical protein ACN28E_15880 [Archangium lansingense]|uniref:hypothetical protein n=1 Tax=Archangium lansingense TaxID=2995310 RepID=UPI003B7A3F3E